MQTFSTCMQCQAEDGRPNLSSIAMARIPDDGVLETTCSRGHRTIIIIQQTKFELLSEMAIRAIVDGYYRDAVASFGGSFERLQEFFIRAACRKRGIDAPTFERAWREMSNQSERQLGGFVSLYLFETGGTPKLLAQKRASFRNGVIHKGTFPRREDTIEFCQAVLECALPVLRQLRSESYSTYVQTLVMESISDRSSSAQKAQQRTSTLSIRTFLSLMSADEQNNVEAAVASYAAQPDFGKAFETAQRLGAIIEAARQGASTV